MRRRKDGKSKPFSQHILLFFLNLSTSTTSLVLFTSTSMVLTTLVLDLDVLPRCTKLDMLIIYYSILKFQLTHMNLNVGAKKRWQICSAGPVLKIDCNSRAAKKVQSKIQENVKRRFVEKFVTFPQPQSLASLPPAAAIV